MTDRIQIGVELDFIEHEFSIFVIHLPFVNRLDSLYILPENDLVRVYCFYLYRLCQFDPLHPLLLLFALLVHVYYILGRKQKKV